MSAILDPAIRAALRPFLRERHGPAAHLFEEVGLERGEAIADVLVAADAIHVYEIKSDGDSLVRLKRQVPVYGLVAATATLVVGEAHARVAAKHIPDWWGLLVAVGAAGTLRLECARDGAPNPQRNFAAVARLLWNAELLKLLRAHGAAKDLPSKSRDALCSRVSERLTPELLETEVCQRLAMRGRYWSWRKTQAEPGAALETRRRRASAPEPQARLPLTGGAR